MSKKKLTKNQHRRIRSKQERRLKKDNSPQWQDDMLGPSQDGKIISRYSMHADVEDTHGNIYRCNIRRNVADVVVGDNVVWREGSEQMQGISGVIEAVYPRASELTRPDYYDGIKTVAANINRIFVVSAIHPQWSLNIIDRYLVVCELMKIEPIIIMNKMNLATEEQRETLDKESSIYQKLGYQTLYVSAESGEGIDKLKQAMKAHCSIFAGQSGVGKSTLINHILPQAEAQTGVISENSGLGQHTTTVSQLYHLPDGGEVIDSPGIREFGLWHLDAKQITEGYREFAAFLGTCKFRDCTHLDDPGCALRQAVENGEINPIRFENYHRLIKALTENKGQRHFFTQ